MKLAILTTTGFVFCHTNDSHTTSNSENVDLGDDIRLTPCQAEKFAELGYQVNAFGPTEDNERACSKKEKAQAIGTKWDANWSASENRWLVAYYFDDVDSAYDDDTKATIRATFDKWGQETCVKMVEKSKTDTEFEYKMNIKQGGGCWSYVGRYYKDQAVSLDSGCQWGTTPLHEVMHALGFWHEQQRGDRDNHITVNRHHSTMDDYSFNVNFGTTIFTWEPTGLAYDFDSIMHYSAYATASCWPDCPVLTYKGTNDPVVTTYHSRGTFSDTDIAEINMRYPCDMSLDDTSNDETTTTLKDELETIRMENKQLMEDWSESNSKPIRKEKLGKRMGRVQNLLNYLDGSKTHYLTNQDCTDFDTALPATVVADFNAHESASTVSDSFNYLKSFYSGAFDHVTRRCSISESKMQEKFTRMKDRFGRLMDLIIAKYQF